jgi:hypothetical protein
MNRSFRRGLVAALAVAALAVTVARPRGGEPNPPTRQEFMRQKLDYSKRVLEGLTVENYDLIARNARALRTLSAAAEWEVPTIPNADEYVVFTGEFQKLCEELTQKSRDRNIDGATLAYLRLTMNCVNCHKYVRARSK